jgi:hypothetical protein
MWTACLLVATVESVRLLLVLLTTVACSGEPSSDRVTGEDAGDAGTGADAGDADAAVCSPDCEVTRPTTAATCTFGVSPVACKPALTAGWVGTVPACGEVGQWMPGCVLDGQLCNYGLPYESVQVCKP